MLHWKNYSFGHNQLASNYIYFKNYFSFISVFYIKFKWSLFVFKVSYTKFIQKLVYYRSKLIKKLWYGNSGYCVRSICTKCRWFYYNSRIKNHLLYFRDFTKKINQCPLDNIYFDIIIFFCLFICLYLNTYIFIYRYINIYIYRYGYRYIYT